MINKTQSPLEKYAEQVEGLSKEQKAYCLAIINEFKPELEIFINAVIEKAQDDACLL